MKRYLKIYGIVVLFCLVLLTITLINKYVIKEKIIKDDLGYENKLNKDILANDVSFVDYDYLNNDLEKVDKLLKEKLNEEADIKKKSEYYYVSQNVYQNKLNEILRVLNDRLDDEDFNILFNDIDDFYKNIEYAIEEIKQTNKSSIDVSYNTNKYMYEEKQKKCKEILENYKGFLKE